MSNKRQKRNSILQVPISVPTTAISTLNPEPSPSPLLIYTFTSSGPYIANESIHILARTDKDCIDKIFLHYEKFQKLFELSLFTDWNSGGLINDAIIHKNTYIKDSKPLISEIYDVLMKGYDSTIISISTKLSQNKSLCRQLVEENKDNLLLWITSYNDLQSISYFKSNIDNIIK